MNRSDFQKIVYLGDGVYAGNDGYQIWIWVQDSNAIALEPRVMANLKQYEKMLIDESQKSNEN